jgi:energy-coupling factor transport system substrate-specific component
MTATAPGTDARWTLRETVTIAVISVVFGMLYLAWVQLWLFVQGLTGSLAMDVLFGFWFVGSIFAAYAIRKPGVAFATAVIASIAEVLTGNPSGAILILTGVVQGAGAEVPFALTRWRMYRLPVLLASGASASVFSFVYTWIRFSYWELDPGLLVLMFVLRVASGVLLGGLVGKFLADQVQKTGVLNGFALDIEKRRSG